MPSRNLGKIVRVRRDKVTLTLHANFLPCSRYERSGFNAALHECNKVDRGTSLTLTRIADARDALPFDKLKLLTHDGYYGVLKNELSERQRHCRWKLALEECAGTQSEVAPSDLLGYTGSCFRLEPPKLFP